VAVVDEDCVVLVEEDSVDEESGVEELAVEELTVDEVASVAVDVAVLESVVDELESLAVVVADVELESVVEPEAVDDAAESVVVSVAVEDDESVPVGSPSGTEMGPTTMSSRGNTESTMSPAKYVSQPAQCAQWREGGTDRWDGP
jgi:hypothetical protein